MYRREEGIGNGKLKNKKYEQMWLNDSKTWNFTHREVSIWKDSLSLDNEFVFNENYELHEKRTIHHKNINRFDNTPDNLVRMNSKDHILYHQHSSSNSGKIGGRNCYEKRLGWHNKDNPEYKNWHIKAGKIGGKVSSERKKSQDNFLKGRQIFANLLKDDDYHSEFIKKIKDGWTEDKKIIASNHAKRNELSKRSNDAKKELYKTESHKIKHSNLYKVEYPDGIFEIVKKCLEDKLTVQETVEVLNNSDILDTWKILNKDKCLSKKQKTFDSFTKHDLRKIAKKYTNKSYKQLKEEVIFKNHKVVKIEYLNERRDVGCLTIDGEELYHNYHTFALDAGVYTQNSILEDFWLPRREGGRGTEITTLPGGQNLGELSDIEYFQKKLYRALGVPESRIAGGGDGFNLGRSSEILRDELKFSKFVGRLRKRFSNMFNDILRTQLLLKNIVSPEDWERMEDHIQYDFLYDNHFAELKESELITNRLTVLTTLEPYIGKYYSVEYVRKKILRQTDGEIVEIDTQIKDEIEKGILPDPNAPVDEMGNPIPIEGAVGEQPALGEIPEDQLAPEAPMVSVEPKGGKI